jgi:hypothetical protein
MAEADPLLQEILDSLVVLDAQKVLIIWNLPLDCVVKVLVDVVLVVRFEARNGDYVREHVDAPMADTCRFLDHDG